MKTKLTIEGDRFLINGSLVYSELPHAPASVHGLLMNARMIQGVFEDQMAPERFHRYGKSFSAERNTAELAAALPQWYARGLRAITVGFQGGGPCFTIDNATIENNPYGSDGLSIDPRYLARMDQLIRAADAIGMVVIVSLFYGAQTRFLKDDIAVLQAVKTAANWLRDQGFSNVILEIANEHDISEYRRHPILYSPEGMVTLLDLARRESGGIPVGCSGTGGYFNFDVANTSDVILIHGNDQSPQRLYNLIEKAKSVLPKRPIVINEDSQAISRLPLAVREGVSWGYYNNMTKQEPPAYWEITKGEDEFFSLRLAELLGIRETLPEEKDRFYLQGLEPNMTYEGKRWIRLASLYPEKIEYVEFYRDGHLVGRAYEDPFMLNSVGSNWLQKPFPETIKAGEVWMARIHLLDGRIAETIQTVQE